MLLQKLTIAISSSVWSCTWRSFALWIQEFWWVLSCIDLLQIITTYEVTVVVIIWSRSIQEKTHQVTSWVLWSCHVQKTTFHSTLLSLLILTFFPLPSMMFHSHGDNRVNICWEPRLSSSAFWCCMVLSISVIYCYKRIFWQYQEQPKNKVNHKYLESNMAAK